MEGIQNTYDALWAKAVQYFRRNRFKIDAHLNGRRRDTRRGLTLITRLDEGTASNVLFFLNACKSIDPDQHYYDQRNLHMTVLSIITCTPDFSLTGMDCEPYAEIMEKVIRDFNPFKVAFQGITATPECVMLQGLPLDGTLKSLRNQLRDAFKGSSLAHSIDKRFVIDIAHSTVLRFSRPVTNCVAFVDLLERYRNYCFGIFEVNKVEFVYTDWYMSPSVVSAIKTFEL